MRPKPLASCVLVLWVAVLGVAHADGTDDFVRAQMKAQNIPGLSLAVVKDGVVIKAAGYGVADRKTNTPATPETVYKIASVSKQFIATGIMLLAQEGRLGVDDPVKKFIADAPAAGPASPFAICSRTPPVSCASRRRSTLSGPTPTPT